MEKKLTEDELKYLQENISKLNQVHIKLGRLENKKNKIKPENKNNLC